MPSEQQAEEEERRTEVKEGQWPGPLQSLEEVQVIVWKRHGAIVGFPPGANLVISRRFPEDLEFYLEASSSLQSLDAEIWNAGQMTRADVV